MTKREYLKYLIRKEVDCLSEEEQLYFYNNITYDIIDEYIDETLTAMLIEDITEKPNYFREELNLNKLLKDLENKN